MIPSSLPQHDPDPEARLRALEAARERYVYDGPVLLPFRLFRELPDDDSYGLVEYGRLLAANRGLNANFLAVKLRTLFDRFDELQDYEDLFTVFARPAIADTWRSDAAFAEQRLSGVETRVLRRIDRLPDNLAVEPDLFRQIATVPLDQAQFEGKLLLADYALLDGLPAGGERERSRFVYAPLALFCWVDDPDAARDAPPAQRGRLVPVAIQLDQRPTRTNLYTPLDGADWLLARTAVQAADATLNMIGHHLARVHLGMEAFALAAARQLGEHHPIRRLLRPHLRHLLVQDEVARRELLNPGGYIERLYGPTLPGALELAARSRQQWRVDDWSFPRDLELRGLDGDAVAHYPWRDDGRLVWDAVAEFTDGYVHWAYASEAELAADEELHAFVGELGDPSGGDLRGLPSVLTRPALAALLADVVFTVGPYHSAMNYRQAEYATFVPNYPAALYGPLPAERGAADDAALLAVLPPQAQSLLQLEFVARLTSFQLDRLGHYAADDLLDDPPPLHDMIVRFQERLVSAEQRIEARNRERAVPYRGMLPSGIANGASV
jgi:arachidonate 15-lipoxygenase